MVRRKKEPTTPELQQDLFSGLPSPIFSVSEFLDYVNALVGAKRSAVQGEVTGWKPHPTGMYFSLKDQEDESIMECYMSPYTYRGLGIAVEDGMKVKVEGLARVRKNRGRFSFQAETMELMGEGSLKKAYELLKAKLEAEGLFERKRVLPQFIQRIGVVTSRTGAVIDDFRKNLKRRGFEVFLCDVRVEGAQAVEGITSAIRWFNKRKPDLDVLVVMRGGGSLEDLQAFNNELVVRDIFGSKIPTICAIGHDRDVPIAQMVSDVAPSTPTAAAVAINQSWDALDRGLPHHGRALGYAFDSLLRDRKADILRMTERLTAYFQRLFHHAGTMSRQIAIALTRTQTRVIALQQQTGALLASLALRLDRAVTKQLEKVQGYDKYLTSVSPERNLKLGYSIIRNETGQVIRNIKNIRVGEALSTKLHQGTFTSEVTTVLEDTA